MAASMEISEKMAQQPRSAARLANRQRFKKWTAWVLFSLTLGLMILGAVVAPDKQLEAQTTPETTPPSVEKIEGSEDGKPAGEEGEKPAGETTPTEEKPAIDPTKDPVAPPTHTGAIPAASKVSFKVDPKSDGASIQQPAIDSVTSDETPKLSGSGKPGSFVEVILDGKSVTTLEVDADGHWSFTPEQPLAAGDHTLEVKIGEKPAAPQDVAKKKVVGEGEGSGVLDRSLSFLGIFFLIAVAVGMSNNRKKINWKLVGIGVGLQLLFAIFIFYVPGGKWIFAGATAVVEKLLAFTGEGSKFIFMSYVTGNWEPALINFTFAVLPTIIFFSSLMTILYHTGIMQRLVYIFAFVMQRAMGTSGAESLSAAANIFVGQTEAPLVIKPYVDKMTNSELMTVMTGGFATVAGGVLALYVGMLKPTFPDIAGHLLAASVMSAPAALVIGKIIYPETETPETSGDLELDTESPDSNVIDAASRGASEGLMLALNVGAMLLAFIALIALVNYIVSFPSLAMNKFVVLDNLNEFFTANKMAIPEGCAVDGVKDDAIVGCIDSMKGILGTSEVAGAAAAADVSAWPMITLQIICGYIFAPFAFAMGVPWSDCLLIGQLLGEKMILNELVAYSSLQKMLADPNIQLADRSVIIATYALCGFANFGSIGIQLGGIGGIAPSRRGDLAKIAFKAMLAGTLAAFMTGTIAGILV